MSNSAEEKERVHKLLVDALPLLCKNAVNYDSEISIEALVGITIDQDKVLLVSIKKDFQKERIRPPPKAVAPPMPSRRQLRQQQHQLQQQKQQQQLLRQQQLMQQQWLLDYDDDEDEEEEEEEEEEEAEWQRQAMLLHQQRQQKIEQQQQQEDTLMRIRQAALTAATGGSMSAMRKLRNQELPKRRGRDAPVMAKPMGAPPAEKRLRKHVSTVTSVSSSSDPQPSPLKRKRGSPVAKQPTVVSIKKESEEPTYTGVYIDSQPTTDVMIKTEVKEEPNDVQQDSAMEETTIHVTKKAGTKMETENEKESQSMKDEEQEEEEEEEFYEGQTNQTGEDDPEVASKLLDIPVRIPATEVKKHFSIVKGETVDDESGIQSQTAAYCCNKCGKTYESEIAIEDHILVSHMKILRYSCPVCAQHFGFRSAMTSHMREDHESESNT